MKPLLTGQGEGFTMTRAGINAFRHGATTKLYNQHTLTASLEIRVGIQHFPCYKLVTILLNDDSNLEVL